jgi:hypothetical protein
MGKSASAFRLTLSEMRSKTFASVKSSVKSAGNVLGNAKMSKSNQQQRSGSGPRRRQKAFSRPEESGVLVSGSKRETTSSRWRQN